MTRTTNARIAGTTFLLYIIVGISQMVLFGGTTAGDGAAEKLATMAQRATDVRINTVFWMLTCFFALALGGALYALTKDEDPDLAMLGLMCRVGEGVVGAVPIPTRLGLLALANETTKTPTGPDADALLTVVLAAGSWNVVVAATFFAVGSLLFCWLLLRGRILPVGLAWLGVAASLLLVIGLPLRLAGVLEGPVAMAVWIPMAVFEIAGGLWLIVKGAPPRVAG